MQGNQRITWAALPESVRAGVERILGEPVVAARSQPGGFSPGSADRVTLASGRKAFVKAASADTNAMTVTLHRREAAISLALPPEVPAPRFLGMYDDGTWVALVLADVDGRHPGEPWQEADVLQVLDALAEIGSLPLPAGLSLPEEAALPRYEDSLRGAFLGWEKLISRPLEGMDPWASGHLQELAALAREGVDALAGDSLVHGDLRADNVLLTGQGAVLLDWPWAAVGAGWVDGLSVLINVKTQDPAVDLDPWFTRHSVFSGASAQAIDAVLAGFTGYFLDMSRRPAPPGIPTLRALQGSQAKVLIGWLQAR